MGKRGQPLQSSAGKAQKSSGRQNGAWIVEASGPDAVPGALPGDRAAVRRPKGMWARPTVAPSSSQTWAKTPMATTSMYSPSRAAKSWRCFRGVQSRHSGAEAETGSSSIFALLVSQSLQTLERDLRGISCMAQSCEMTYHQHSRASREVGCFAPLSAPKGVEPSGCGARPCRLFRNVPWPIKDHKEIY